LNPFDALGVYVEENRMYIIERSSTSDRWSYSSDFSKVIPKFPYQSRLPAAGAHALSEFFTLYNWSPSGHEKIGSWIEAAATQAGR
jgi:hypothetical protein